MLQQLEKQIEAAEGNPWQKAKNLEIIHDEKFYEPKYRSFAAYCRKRWRYSRQSAYNYISAMQVAKTCGIRISRELKITPLRPLFKLDPARQQKAWAAATKNAENSIPTGAEIKFAATALTEDSVVLSWDERVAFSTIQESLKRAIRAACEKADDRQRRELLQKLPHKVNEALQSIGATTFEGSILGMATALERRYNQSHGT